MDFKTLTNSYEQLEATTKRLEMLEILKELFRKTPKKDLKKVLYFTSGKIYLDYIDCELGFANKMVIKAIAKATTTTTTKVKKLFNTIGDLGIVIEKLKENSGQKTIGSFFSTDTKPQSLTVAQVWETLDKIAKLEGTGSVSKKINYLIGLYSRATTIEAKYITRTVLSQLRLGVKELSIIEALAQTFGTDENSREYIEHAYNIRCDIGEVGEILATQGIEAVKELKIQIGRPIRMMAAQRLQTPEEILEKLGGKCALEYKYDGERVQAHITPKQVILFSRNLNDISSMYPDVVKGLQQALPKSCLIVEGEITAWDPEKESLKPFQLLMSRKRKHDIIKTMENVPVKVFLFDLLYLDSKGLLQESYPERRRKLEEVIQQTKNISIASRTLVSEINDFEQVFDKSLAFGCEGIMAKDIRRNTPYQAGNRGFLWIKHKFDYESSFADSFDFVIVGAFYGKGRRAGTFGTLLMATYNQHKEQFETVCKLGSGFSDKNLEDLKKLLLKRKMEKKPKDIVSKLEPDIWVPPQKVLEVQGADLSFSPVHTCALGEIEKETGIAVRFPRFIRFREDKNPKQATSSEEIIKSYKSQRLKIGKK
jgi:DNA ligase-1